jgi:hypothetical protein
MWPAVRLGDLVSTTHSRVRSGLIIKKNSVVRWNEHAYARGIH